MMASYYLQDGLPDNPLGRQESRTFLDDRIHPGCDVLDVIVADSWIDARVDAPL